MKRIGILIIVLLFNNVLNAQCAMCKAVVESGNLSEAEGLNRGILYLMVFPYILVGTLLYFIIKYIESSNKQFTISINRGELVYETLAVI